MDPQSSAWKAEEESELLRELAESDTESSAPVSRFQSMRWPALAMLCSLVAVGVVNMMGSRGIAVADVAATVGLSGWNAYIDQVVQKSKMQCDQAILIHFDGAQMTSPGRAKSLPMTPAETKAVGMNLKTEDYSSWMASGIMVGGKKYLYVKQCNGIFTFKKKGQGVISVAKTQETAVVAHTPDGSDARLTNLAVKEVASYLESQGMRRLMRGDDTTEYARRLQFDEDAPAVVVDVDSNPIRAGSAGEDAPTVTEPPNADDFKLRMEQVYNKLEVEASTQVVLISEAPLTPPESKKERTTTLFEELKVPGMCMANAAVLAAYAAGKTTAAVLYIADDAFYAVPVYEGVPLDWATIHESKGEDSADKYAETVYNSIMKTDVDIRKDLYANVVISGDSTLADSLKEKLAELAPPTMKIEVVGEDEGTKGLTPWIGGSIFASLSTFPVITDKMYNEMGPDVAVNTCL